MTTVLPPFLFLTGTMLPRNQSFFAQTYNFASFFNRASTSCEIVYLSIIEKFCSFGSLFCIVLDRQGIQYPSLSVKNFDALLVFLSCLGNGRVSLLIADFKLQITCF